MRKRMGFGILLGLLVGYPFELSARTVCIEEKNFVQEHFKKTNRIETTTPEDFIFAGPYQTLPA